MFTKEFAKSLLAGHKKLLKKKDVNFIEVKKYDELSVKRLYSEFIQLDGMHYYFPDKYPVGRQCDRDYMFNIANTLYFDMTQEIIAHAQIQRRATEAEHVQNESIMMSEHWKEEL